MRPRSRRCSYALQTQPSNIDNVCPRLFATRTIINNTGKTVGRESAPRREARAIIRDHADPELVERLEHLDAIRELRPRDASIPAPGAGTRFDTDVVFLGGGLSLLIAAQVARLGRRVVVLERARAGVGHRDWNASEAELSGLVGAGLLTEREIRALIVARYDEGLCAFHGFGETTVQGVLDCAVDAAALLARVRAIALAHGVRFVDGAQVRALGAGPAGVRVAWTGGELVAKLAVDARGSSSPYSSADLLCPTVGGAFRGLDFDSKRGEILVTTEDADHGRQHIWEGFPGLPGELTVYLFYYARRSAAGTLLDLYARFFERLGDYKSGAATLVRPTFGFIPGWSRLSPAPRAPHPRVILVGDAAARHSPLTFCGFGAMLRTFQSVGERIASTHDSPATDEPIHGWTGLLASLVASERLHGSEANALLSAAFSSLSSLGNEAYAALLQDRMSAHDFVRFLRLTARRHPIVYRSTARVAGPVALAHWASRLARSALAERLSAATGIPA